MITIRNAKNYVYNVWTIQLLWKTRAVTSMEMGGNDANKLVIKWDCLFSFFQLIVIAIKHLVSVTPVMMSELGFTNNVTVLCRDWLYWLTHTFQQESHVRHFNRKMALVSILYMIYECKWTFHNVKMNSIYVSSFGALRTVIIRSVILTSC